MMGLTTIRVCPLEINKNLITFNSKLEEDNFKLTANTDQITQITYFLNKEIDLEMFYERNDEGNITAGIILSFNPIDYDSDPWTAWKKWFDMVK